MRKSIYMFGYVGVLVAAISLQSCNDDPITPDDGTGNGTDTTWVDDSTNTGGGEDSTFNGGGTDPGDSTGGWSGGGDPGDSTGWSGGGDVPGDSTGWNGDSTTIGGQQVNRSKKGVAQYLKQPLLYRIKRSKLCINKDLTVTFICKF